MEFLFDSSKVHDISYEHIKHFSMRCIEVIITKWKMRK